MKEKREISALEKLLLVFIVFLLMLANYSTISAFMTGVGMGLFDSINR